MADLELGLGLVALHTELSSERAFHTMLRTAQFRTLWWATDCVPRPCLAPSNALVAFVNLLKDIVARQAWNNDAADFSQEAIANCDVASFLPVLL